jgi:hypothetical protein
MVRGTEGRGGGGAAIETPADIPLGDADHRKVRDEDIHKLANLP